MNIEHYDANEMKAKYNKTYEMLMEYSKEDLANYIACQTLFGKQKLEN
jgi:peroxiredoxin family protein